LGVAIGECLLIAIRFFRKTHRLWVRDWCVLNKEISLFNCDLK